MGARICTRSRSHDRGRWWAALLALALAGAQGCAPADETPELEEPGEARDERAPGIMEEELPPVVPEERLLSWNVDFGDDQSDSAAFRIVQLDGGLTVTTGPAGIAWRPADLIESGDFAVSADFVRTGAPSRDDEGYGLLVGGRHLQSPDQGYLGFMVRGDGEYRVQRRSGGEAEELVPWTPHSAIEIVRREGEEVRNALAVEVDGERVRFLVNGVAVDSMAVPEAQPWGFAGLSVGEDLDLHVQSWIVEETGPEGQPTEPPGDRPGEVGDRPAGAPGGRP